MSKIGIFMADGCEEIEGLTVVDVVRRAKMEIVMLSINRKKRSDKLSRGYFFSRCACRRNRI